MLTLTTILLILFGIYVMFGGFGILIKTNPKDIIDVISSIIASLLIFGTYALLIFSLYKCGLWG